MRTHPHNTHNIKIKFLRRFFLSHFELCRFTKSNFLLFTVAGTGFYCYGIIIKNAIKNTLVDNQFERQSY